MPTKRTKAMGSKTKLGDGVRSSKFSMVRSGPLRRAVNEAMDTLPPPKDLVGGKFEVELLEDGEVRIEYDFAYNDPRARTVETAETSE